MDIFEENLSVTAKATAALACIALKVERPGVLPNLCTASIAFESMALVALAGPTQPGDENSMSAEDRRTLGYQQLSLGLFILANGFKKRPLMRDCIEGFGVATAFVGTIYFGSRTLATHLQGAREKRRKALLSKPIL